MVFALNPTTPTNLTLNWPRRRAASPAMGEQMGGTATAQSPQSQGSGGDTFNRSSGQTQQGGQSGGQTGSGGLNSPARGNQSSPSTGQANTSTGGGGGNQTGSGTGGSGGTSPNRPYGSSTY